MNSDNNFSKTGLLIFRIGSQLFGVELRHIFRVNELLPITRVPLAPEFLSGIVCFEGEVFPVFDGRLKLGFEKAELSSTSSLLFLKFEIDEKAVAAAMIVDEVLRVIDWNGEAELENSSKMQSTYLTGLTEYADETILLFDVSRVFGRNEFAEQI